MTVMRPAEPVHRPAGRRSSGDPLIAGPPSKSTDPDVRSPSRPRTAVNPRARVEATSDRQRHGVLRWCRAERVTRYRASARHHEVVRPSRASGCVWSCPLSCDVAGNDQDRPGQSAARGEQSPEKRLQGGERRVCHNEIGAAREPEVARVSPDDRHPSRVVAHPQLVGSLGMELNRDHTRSGGQERVDDDARTGADVDYEITGADAGIGHEGVGP